MDLQTIGFDAERALQVASSIARPRLVGTDEEKQVGQQMAACLEAYGYQVQPEPFRFSDAHSVFLIGEILLCQLLIGATLWLNARESPVQSVTAVLVILFLGLISGLNRAVQEGSLAEDGKQGSAWSRFCQRVGRKFQATNYVARMPGQKTESSDLHLTLVAHYDSKSQRMPLAARMTFFILGMGGGLVFAVLILLSPILPALVTPALAFGGLALLAGVPLWFLDLGNESPGAIDNASSVGLVMQLAEALAQHPEICHQLDLTILLTSAEEASTMGAVAYVHRHEKRLRAQAKFGRAYVLNFDGIGVDGPLRWVGQAGEIVDPSKPCLLCLVRQACIELGGEVKIFNLPGALYDHIPFSSLGLDAGTLVAVNRASLAVHTRGDTTEKLDVRGFQQSGQTVLKVIEALLKLPKLEHTVPDIGIEEADIYKHDPLMRFLREKMRLTPRMILLAGIGLGVADLLIARAYDFWYSRDGIVGVLQDPPYLLTIFVIMPLFLRTYLWLPDGMFNLLQSLPRNHLIRGRDMPTYRDNVRILVERYTRSLALVTLFIAIVLEILVLVLNYQTNYPSFNNIFTARLVLIRIPYGLLALYAATFVVVRSLLNLDWGQLFKDLEPQINPLYPDLAVGYGVFTQYIANLLGIFVAIATFFFTKALFQPSESGTVVSFHPVYDMRILASTVVYLVVGFYVFLYIPTGAARRAIKLAKRWQCETIAEQYRTEQKVLMDLTRQAGSDPQDLLAMKNQMEKLRLLNETSTLMESIPTSPINRRTFQRFGLSYISIYLFTVVYNLLRAYFTPGTGEEFRALLETGSLGQILEGVIKILLTGQL